MTLQEHLIRLKRYALQQRKQLQIMAAVESRMKKPAATLSPPAIPRHGLYWQYVSIATSKHRYGYVEYAYIINALTRGCCVSHMTGMRREFFSETTSVLHVYAILDSTQLVTRATIWMPSYSRDEFEMTSLFFVGTLCCPVPCMVVLCCRLCGKRVDCACLNCFSDGNCKCCCCQIEPRKFRQLPRPSQAEGESITSGICLAYHQFISYYTRLVKIGYGIIYINF